MKKFRITSLDKQEKRAIRNSALYGGLSGLFAASISPYIKPSRKEVAKAVKDAFKREIEGKNTPENIKKAIKNTKILRAAKYGASAGLAGGGLAYLANKVAQRRNQNRITSSENTNNKQPSKYLPINVGIATGGLAGMGAKNFKIGINQDKIKYNYGYRGNSPYNERKDKLDKLKKNYIESKKTLLGLKNNKMYMDYLEKGYIEGIDNKKQLERLKNLDADKLSKHTYGKIDKAYKILDKKYLGAAKLKDAGTRLGIGLGVGGLTYGAIKKLQNIKNNVTSSEDNKNRLKKLGTTALGVGTAALLLKGKLPKFIKNKRKLSVGESNINELNKKFKEDFLNPKLTRVSSYSETPYEDVKKLYPNFKPTNDANYFLSFENVKGPAYFRDPEYNKLMRVAISREAIDNLKKAKNPNLNKMAQFWDKHIIKY